MKNSTVRPEIPMKIEPHPSQVGLRPLTIFGVGREIGLTSGPTKAVKAAILGRRFEIEASATEIWMFPAQHLKFFHVFP